MKNIKQKLSFGLAGLLLMGTFLVTPSAYAQTATNTDTVIQFVNTIQVGQRGDLVKILQAILAKDPTILDEKYITGYFGPKTKEAVKKYQKKNGLSQVGNVGPKTLALINKELGTQPVATSTTTTETGSTTNCVKVPPGHLIAPGFIKKNGQVQAPTCMVLPPGIAKKMGGTWNNGNDTVAPVLTLGAASGLSTTGATINFTANEPVVFELFYGTSTAYGTTVAKTTTAATVNTKALTGLTANTPYFYQVKAYDAAGNMTSATGTFTTLAVADTVAPTISGLAVTGVTTNGATIGFNTDENTVFEVLYGTTTAYGTTTTKTTTPAMVGSQVLTGLIPNTPYFYQVKVYDGANNMSSTTGTFTTLADTTAPVISGVTVSTITATGATIAWTTNENASTKVYVSTTTPVNKATASPIVTGPTNVTTHNVTVSGLTANTHYYFLIESTDSSSNMTTSAEASFITTI